MWVEPELLHSGGDVARSAGQRVLGGERGQYLAPDGTLFADRALTPESVTGEYHRYSVTGKPLPDGRQILEGPVQPWYGQTPSPGVRSSGRFGPQRTVR